MKKHGLISKASKGYGAWAVGSQLAIKFMAMLLCPVFGGLVCGMWLDNMWQTAPWLMIILMFLGFVFSIYAVYRVATRNQQLTRSREKANES
ncbi:MAG: AtpZ/AtpI family protein [Chloroflexi bacterium]|nr:MAG: AtpZ/AtpI family protein [Chloroflexota bacterium]